MKVLFAGAEASPFAQTGGLGDVIGSLPPALSKEGICASVIMPYYSFIKDEFKNDMELFGELSFKYGWRNSDARVLKYNKDGTDYYFVDNGYYFNREKLYGEYDDGERFAFFSIAVLEFVIKFMPELDILHTNDWHTALCNVYLKTIYKDTPQLKKLKTIFTIHNIKYQGIYDISIKEDVFSIDEKDLHLLEYNSNINLLKGALVCADKITTVSPRYKEELKYDYFGFGLSELIKKESQKIIGVLNGIDVNEFSPKGGEGIYHAFNRRDAVSGKRKNKEKLYAELKIDRSTDSPLIIMVTRLSEEKGIDLILHILEEVLIKDVQMIILGSGEECYERSFLELSSKHDNLRFIQGFNKDLAKKLYASADIFIMPSKTEPCGLAQMIACLFGTVPIVRATGGLADTIIPYGEEGSNGFVFENYNAHELLNKINQALNLMKNKNKWRAMIQRCMNSDFSWRASALKYIRIYKELLD